MPWLTLIRNLILCGLRAVKQRARVRDELAIDLGGVVDADLNTFRGVLQADPGHARALAGVRADAQEQSGLVGGRLGHKRELGDEHLIGPRLADLYVAPVGNTSGRRTHQTHMRSTYATIDCRTQEARQEERQCWRRPPGRTVRWLGLGHTPGSPQAGALFQGKPPTPLCPLTDPRWKRIGSKSVMEAAATPPGSRAKLTNVARTPTIAARGARRVRRLESRTATPSPENMTGQTGKALIWRRPYPSSAWAVNLSGWSCKLPFARPPDGP